MNDFILSGGFKIIIAVIMTIGIFMIALGITKEHVVMNFVHRIRDKTEKEFVQRKMNRYVSDYFNCVVSKWCDTTYKYSRFYTNHKHLKTSAHYFLFSVLFSFACGFLFLTISKRILMLLLGFILGIGITYGYLFLLRIKNKRAVNSDVLSFLNLLGNYSTGNTEVTSVFMQIAPKMNEPLRSCLVECVAETQNPDKNPIKALENLQNKIESKKFREIIRNLSISQKYSGSFYNTVVQNRATISSFLKSQKEQKELAQQNTINLSVCTVALMLVLAVLGQIVGENLLLSLFTTTIGNVVLVIMVLCILYFAVKILEVAV